VKKGREGGKRGEGVKLGINQTSLGEEIGWIVGFETKKRRKVQKSSV